MKKLLSATLALTLSASMALGVTACGKKGGSGGKTDAEIASQVITAVRALYIDKYYDGAETPSDYDVIGQYPVEGVYYTVNWSVNVTEGVTVTAMNETTKKVTIDVNETTSADINYTLTASVTVNDATESTNFTGLKVPAFNAEFNTHAQFVAANAGDTLRVRGVVTGIAKKSENTASNARNGIYFEDNDGGYYIYNISALPDGLAIGDEIAVDGTCDVYQSHNQLKDATVAVLSKNKNVTPKDITEVVSAASSADDAESFKAYHSQLVTIKGALLHNNASNTSYVPFKIGNVDSYVYLSTSDCPASKTEQAAVKSAHESNIGKKATVTGIVTYYKATGASEGKYYLVPVSGDAFSEITDANLNDAEKVAEAKKAVASLIETRYHEVEENIALPSESWGANLKWDVEDGKSLVTVIDNKLSIIKLPDEDTKVTLKVEISSGDAKDNATVEITIVAAAKHAGTLEDPYTVSEALAIAKELGSGEWTDKVIYMEGIAVNTASPVNSYYGSFNVKDESDPSQSILVYSINLRDSVAAPVQNDKVLVSGYITNYNGNTLEFSRRSIDGTYTEVYLEKNTRGTSTITLGAHAGATVNDLPNTATNGDEVQFSVTLDANKELVSVKAGGKTLQESGGVYKFTVEGNMTVTVETKDQGAQDAVELAKLSFDDDAKSSDGKVSSYTGSFEATRGGVTWVIESFNNNNGYGSNWTYIKTGRNNGNAVTGKITTKAALSQTISKVVINIDPSSELSNVNSCKLVVFTKDGSTENIVDTITVTIATGDVEFTINNPGANYYYRLEVDCAGGSKNGFVVLNSISYWGFEN